MRFLNEHILKKRIQAYKVDKNPEKLIKSLKKQNLVTLVKVLLSNAPEFFEEVLLLYFEYYTNPLEESVHR